MKVDLFVEDEPTIHWQRYGGYECSSIGDTRFSAFYAMMPDGRSIEHHYQCDVKGYDPGGTNWRLAKGRAAKDGKTHHQLWSEYLLLWKTWAADNLPLLKELYQKALEHHGILSDFFASTEINQANALAHILNEYKAKGLL